MFIKLNIDWLSSSAFHYNDISIKSWYINPIAVDLTVKLSKVEVALDSNRIEH